MAYQTLTKFHQFLMRWPEGSSIFIDTGKPEGGASRPNCSPSSLARGVERATVESNKVFPVAQFESSFAWFSVPGDQFAID